MSLKKALETPNNIKYDVYLTWLTEDTVRKISADQKEPEWMLELRLKSLEIYNNMPMPKRWPDLSELMPLIEGSQHEIIPLIDPSFSSLLQGEKLESSKNRQIDLTQEDVKKRWLVWDWKSFPYNPNNVEKSKKLRKNMTKAEKKLWYDFLKKSKYKFYRQRPIDHFIVDFYCSKLNLVIEVDGGIHYTQKEYDQMRTEFLNLYGLNVIRFENNEILHNFDNVCKKIEKYINTNNFSPERGDAAKAVEGSKKGDHDWLVWYARPSSDNTGYATNRDDVPQEIKDKFDKLWIPEAEKKYLAGAWWQMDSVNFYHKIKEKWAKVWVIFEDMPTAIQTHPELVKKYFMKLVPPTDHKFAALHWAVRSWWTFIYVPKWVKVDEPLQAYFRMNTYAWWQFEHTLIIVDDDAECNYIEWCSAPKYDKSSIHTGLVEIFVGKNSKMKYASVENWSTNTYNLNTKRALVEENSYMERVSWNLWSQTTMLYPCSILKWDNSKTEMFWIVLASKGQNQDIWSKVIHIGKNTSSNIVSKSISKDWGISTYRGLVSISKSADNAVSNTQCDAFILDKDSVSITIPTIKDNNGNASISHEASTWKIDESKLFYLSSRGIEISKATSMIVNWFFSQVSKKLPLEYAWELNTLIDIEMENSVW